MRGSLASISIPLGIALCLAGCRTRGTTPGEPPTPVRAVEIPVAPGPQGLRYSASIEPQAQVPLAFQDNGRVKEILLVEEPAGTWREVQLGDVVDGGVPLARLDESDYRDKVTAAKAQLAAALAALEKGDADFKRASNLYATKSITAPDYDRARKEYETALAQVEGARAQLDEAELALTHCTLEAPWAGVVLQRNIQVGQMVEPTVQAFVLADVSSVKAVFGIPDLVLKDVRIGAPMSLRTEAFPDRAFAGRVSAVSPAADQQSRVFQVEVTVPNPDGALRIGMIGSLVLPGTETPAAVIPLDAVVRDPANPKGYAVYVLSQRDGRTIATARPVELGRVRGDEIAVLGGVGPGDRIVSNGASRVVSGAPVRVIP